MPVIVKREKKMLKIQVPLEKPVCSKSGKTMLVASSHGVITTGVTYHGKQVALVVNAFIYPDTIDSVVGQGETGRQARKHQSRDKIPTMARKCGTKEEAKL